MSRRLPMVALALTLCAAAATAQQRDFSKVEIKTTRLAEDIYMLESERELVIRVVRLGSPRAPGEGLRLGTVRWPPRGVPKALYASRDFYDVWVPDLAPSETLLKQGRIADEERAWKAFARRYRAEMKRPETARLLALLAAFSQRSDFSVGCYCAEEARCHRSVLRELLKEHGARLE